MQKTILITGGAQGIGKGIAKLCLEQHLKVIIVDYDAQAGYETEQEYSSLGTIIFLQADIAQEKEIKKTIEWIKQQDNQLDYLVNNAAILIKKPLQALSIEEWNHVLNVNLTAPFLFVKYAAELLEASKGAIVNIASTRALMSEPNTESYAASKGGLVALTHALAISLGPLVRVNCICPGWIEVSEWKKSDIRKTVKHSIQDLQQHPVGAVGEPQDIASLVLYLISPQAKFITGANFIVDGGMTRKMIYEE